MIPAHDMEDAFRITAQKLKKKDLEVLIVPNAILTLPIVDQKTNK